MNAHALVTLEFEKVRRMLFRWTFSVIGHDYIERLGPNLEPDQIDESLRFIEEWKRLEIEGTAPSAGEIDDLRPQLVRVAKAGETLGPEELSLFVPFLSQVRELAVRLKPREDGSTLDLHRLVGGFPDVRDLSRRLSRSISPTGEILSSASPALAKARADLGDAQRHASEQLQSLLDRLTPERRDEAFVTLRDDRYVVSIRGHDRERFPGLLHGRSQSGQSVLVEPVEALEVNNRIAERQEDVRMEELRVLRELTAALQEHAEELVEAYEIVGRCDLIRAQAKLALRLRAEAPSWNREGRLRLVGARHPMLAEAEAEGGTRVVPLDVEMDPEAPVLLVSGPNMGGKTVALKTVGLCCLMLRAGLPVPAAPGTDLPLVDDVFVDLGDEQSIEADLSTFAAHLKNIGELWEDATSRSLVLLDELGGGTDPEEGAALAMAILSEMAGRGALTVATTHLTSLKLFAQEAEGMRNGSMEFDAVSLQPRYVLKVGEPGRSRAFEIARRILPESDLLEKAQPFRSPHLVEMDAVFERVDAERRALAQQTSEFEAKNLRLERLEAKRREQIERLKERIRSVRDARDRLVEEAYRKAQSEIASIRKKLETELEESRDAGGVQSARRAERRVERVRAGRNTRPKGRSRTEASRPKLSPDQIDVGTQAWLPDLRALVRVERVDSSSGKVRVDWGGRHLEVAISALEAPDPSSGNRPARSGGVRYGTNAEPTARELDLRGSRAEDALESLDRFLDQAAMADLGQVRIVHGKGTGTLKREVERALGRHPLVEKYRTGEPSEGGWGVTIALLARMNG